MFNQAIALEPNENWPHLFKAFTLWSMKGATEESRYALESVHPDYHWLPWAWFWQDVGEHKFRRGLQRLAANSNDWVRNKMWAYPKTQLQALIYMYIGKADSAEALFRKTLVQLKEEIQKWPQDPRYHVSLGLAYAALGERENALRECKKAVELLPFPEMRFMVYPARKVWSGYTHCSVTKRRQLIRLNGC